jgi:hypothetical protein
LFPLGSRGPARHGQKGYKFSRAVPGHPATIRLPNEFSDKGGIKSGCQTPNFRTVTTFQIANAAAHEPTINVCFQGKKRALRLVIFSSAF